MGIISSLNNLLSEPANEAFLITTKDLRLNVNLWGKSKDTNVLFITGLSGSGKTTLADNIANTDKNTIVWYLDDLIYGNVKKCDFINQLIKSVPEYKDIMKAYDQHLEIESSKLELIANQIVHFLCIFAKKYWPKYHYIIEGLQLYDYIQPSFVYGKPLIIKNTSVPTTILHAIRRSKDYGSLNMNDNNKLYEFIFNELHWDKRDYSKLKMYKHIQKDRENTNSSGYQL
jgi:energy-coupling factor transporter ATP-binding protein EcfA2